MKKFSTYLKNQEKSEQGSAMVFALIVLMIAFLITMLIGSYALTNILVNQKVSVSSTNELAASEAVNHALLTLNSSALVDGTTVMSSHNSPGTAMTGELPATASSSKTKWAWYSVLGSSPTLGWNYTIYATGYKGPTVATATSKSEAKAVIAGKYLSGSATYVAGSGSTPGKLTYLPGIGYNSDSPSQQAFQWGLMYTNTASFALNSKINSYNSQTNQLPTASLNNSELFGKNVASSVTLGAGVGLNTITKYDTTVPGINPCSGSCSGVQVVSQDYDVSLSQLTTLAATRCPTSTPSDPADSWTSSSANGYILDTTSNKCFTDLNFDGPPGTVIKIKNSSTSTTGANLYVLGNVTVSPGVTVQNANSKLPYALTIYSAKTSASTVTFKQGTTSVPTSFYGSIAGENFTCQDSGTATAATPVLNIYGSLVCKNLSFRAGTTIWEDKAVRGRALGVTTFIWNITSYQKLPS